MTAIKRLFLIVPTFNSALFLERCLKGISDQTHRCDVYLHIQDGGSTDTTLDIARTWIAQHNLEENCLGGRLHLSLVSEDDNGLYDAIAKAAATLEMRDADVMSWIGSDDLMLPGCLRTVELVFGEHRKIDWVAGDNLVIGEDDSWHTPSTIGGYCRASLCAGLHDGRTLRFLKQEGTFWRARLWRMAGGIDASFSNAGDWDLWRRFAALAQPFFLPGIPLAAFRQRKDQKSQDKKAYWDEVDSVRKRLPPPTPEQLLDPDFMPDQCFNYSILKRRSAAKSFTATFDKTSIPFLKSYTRAVLHHGWAKKSGKVPSLRMRGSGVIELDAIRGHSRVGLRIRHARRHLVIKVMHGYKCCGYLRVDGTTSVSNLVFDVDTRRSSRKITVTVRPQATALPIRKGMRNLLRPKSKTAFTIERIVVTPPP